MRVVKVHEDINFTVVMEGEDYPKFKLYEIDGFMEQPQGPLLAPYYQVTKDGKCVDVTDVDEAEWFAEGSVKWDGCSDWRFMEGYYHACTREMLANIGEVLSRCWDMAKEFYGPKWYGYPKRETVHRVWLVNEKEDT